MHNYDNFANVGTVLFLVESRLRYCSLGFFGFTVLVQVPRFRFLLLDTRFLVKCFQGFTFTFNMIPNVLSQVRKNNHILDVSIEPVDVTSVWIMCVMSHNDTIVINIVREKNQR